MNVSKIAGWVANSVDPDQTPRSAASDLDLHCLLVKTRWARAVVWSNRPPRNYYTPPPTHTHTHTHPINKLTWIRYCVAPGTVNLFEIVLILFSYFYAHSIRFGTYLNHLYDAIFLSTHDICFSEKKTLFSLDHVSGAMTNPSNNEGNNLQKKKEKESWKQVYS